MNDEELNPTEMDFGVPEGPEEGEGPPEEGGANAFVEVKKGEELLHKFEIIALPVRIGRKPDNDIALEDKNVSRYHAQIIQKEGAFWVQDMGSTGGTMVNGETVKEKDIHTGDQIQIGQYILAFDSGIPEDDRTVFETDEATVIDEGTVVDEDRTVFYEEPSARLVVIKAGDLEGDVTLEEALVIGRGEDADLTVEDKRLSRQHCRIELAEGKYTLNDLSSANGTFLNGKKITQAELNDKDRIQVGSCQFEFRLEKSAVPKSKGNMKVLLSMAAGIVILAAVSYLTYTYVIARGGRGAKEVMMQKVWEHPAAAGIVSSPALGDLNGDGFVDLAAANVKGVLFALDGRQGGLIWNSAFMTGGVIEGSPVLADINEMDGSLDVLASTASRGMLAIDGGTMKQIWRASTAGNVTSPAAADINKDGTADVFIAEKSGRVLCFDGRQGGLIWSYNTKASIEASVVLSDLNGDRVPDVIVGAENHRVYALNGSNGAILWVYADTETPSTAACAYFNRDRIPDVVLVFPSRVVVLEGKNNAVLWSWNMPEAARPTADDPFTAVPPAIADLNRDGTPDVIVSTPGGHVYAINGKSGGERYLWDYGVGSARKTAPALSDINGDGNTDVVVGDVKGSLIIIDGKTGHKLNELDLGSAVRSAPVIGDFTGDGSIDIAACTAGGKIVAVETQARTKKNRILWGSFGGNAGNTGYTGE